jgi:riboflavin kinase, archaea type
MNDQHIVLRGRVCAGLGDAHVLMADHLDHYERKTGLRLVPGTLNLSLEQPFHFPPHRLRLEAAEYGGTRSISILPCEIGHRPALILRTDRNDLGLGPHPKTIIEIAAEVRLRESLALSDGDVVEIRIAPAQ